MSPELSNPHLTSGEFPDLNIRLIKAVTDNFIHQHGHRDIHTGLPQEPTHLETMAVELNMMMAQPDQGLAEVIPLISFWVDQFSLNFEDELFELERKRLDHNQSIADKLSRLSQKNQSLKVTVNVADILAELPPEEMIHALPLLEEQLIPPEDGSLKNANEQADFINRLKRLLKLPQKKIRLSIDTGELKQSPPSAPRLRQENANREPTELIQQARFWVKRINQQGEHSLQFFIDAYNLEPPELRAAIDQVLMENSHHLNHTSLGSRKGSNLAKRWHSTLSRWLKRQ